MLTGEHAVGRDRAPFGAPGEWPAHEQSPRLLARAVLSPRPALEDRRAPHGDRGQDGRPGRGQRRRDRHRSTRRATTRGAGAARSRVETGRGGSRTSISTRSTVTATIPRVSPGARSLGRPARAAASRMLRDDEMIAVTADHGNDPTTPSTDPPADTRRCSCRAARAMPGRHDLGTRDVRRSRRDHRRRFFDPGAAARRNFLGG